MLKTLIAKKFAALLITAVGTSLLPSLLLERPILSKAWGRWGPMVVDRAVDAASDQIDTRLRQQGGAQ